MCTIIFKNLQDNYCKNEILQFIKKDLNIKQIAKFKFYKTSCKIVLTRKNFEKYNLGDKQIIFQSKNLILEYY